MSNEKNFTIEKHGNGYALYQGRGVMAHGLNLCFMSDFDMNKDKTIEMIESALNNQDALQSRINELEYELNLYKGSLKIPFKNYGDDGTSLSSDEITNLL